MWPNLWLLAHSLFLSRVPKKDQTSSSFPSDSHQLRWNSEDDQSEAVGAAGRYLLETETWGFLLVVVTGSLSTPGETLHWKAQRPTKVCHLLPMRQQHHSVVCIDARVGRNWVGLLRMWASWGDFILCRSCTVDKAPTHRVGREPFRHRHTGSPSGRVLPSKSSAASFLNWARRKQLWSITLYIYMYILFLLKLLPQTVRFSFRLLLESRKTICPLSGSICWTSSTPTCLPTHASVAYCEEIHIQSALHILGVNPKYRMWLCLKDISTIYGKKV